MVIVSQLNPGQVGFYRVQYSSAMLERLLPAIRDNSLPPRDRLGLQSDLFALVNKKTQLDFSFLEQALEHLRLCSHHTRKLLSRHENHTRQGFCSHTFLYRRVEANNRINTVIRRRWRRGILNYLLYVEAISSTTWQGGHVRSQNNRIFSGRIYMKIEFSSQRCFCSWPPTLPPWRHVQNSNLGIGGSFSVLRMIQSPNGVMQIVEETLNNTHITKQWLLFPQHYETYFDTNVF